MARSRLFGTLSINVDKGNNQQRKQQKAWGKQAADLTWLLWRKASFKKLKISLIIRFFNLESNQLKVYFKY